LSTTSAPVAPQAGETPALPEAAPNNAASDFVLWQKIYQEIVNQYAADKNFIRDVGLDRLAGDDLYLSLPAGAIMLEQLTDATRLARLEKAASAVLNRAIKIQFVERAVREPDAKEAAILRRASLAELPAVKTLLTAFNGKVEKVGAAEKAPTITVAPAPIAAPSQSADGAEDDSADGAEDSADED
jgi:hypothetical protein